MLGHTTTPLLKKCMLESLESLEKARKKVKGKKYKGGQQREGRGIYGGEEIGNFRIFKLMMPMFHTSYCMEIVQTLSVSTRSFS